MLQKYPLSANSLTTWLNLNFIANIIALIIIKFKDVIYFLSHDFNSNSTYWLNWPCDAKLSEKCPCLHNNNTALKKQISLFDTALVMTNT